MNQSPTKLAAEPVGPQIEIRGLTKIYAGGIEAVKGIDFQVQPGEAFGLLGPNGAGKSTTVGMLATTIAPTSGTARLAGFDVATDPISVRGVSAVVFQDPVIDRVLSGRRNLAIHSRLWHTPSAVAEARIDELVAAFDLGGVIDRPAGSYSGGQRRPATVPRDRPGIPLGGIYPYG